MLLAIRFTKCDRTPKPFHARNNLHPPRHVQLSGRLTAGKDIISFELLASPRLAFGQIIHLSSDAILPSEDRYHVSGQEGSSIAQIPHSENKHPSNCSVCTDNLNAGVAVMKSAQDG